MRLIYCFSLSRNYKTSTRFGSISIGCFKMRYIKRFSCILCDVLCEVMHMWCAAWNMYATGLIVHPLLYFKRFTLTRLLSELHPGHPSSRGRASVPFTSLGELRIIAIVSKICWRPIYLCLWGLEPTFCRKKSLLAAVLSREREEDSSQNRLEMSKGGFFASTTGTMLIGMSIAAVWVIFSLDGKFE
jgi:hypothetical protein